ncbi:MAG: YitT family protein [Clostridia bacterium]|nr:YitT family protein [Clostridia bacterium]
MSKAKKITLDYLYIAIGSFILAFGINYFLVPMKISTGGVSGVGTVLYYFFDIPLSLTTLAINAVLFVTGFRMLRKSSIVKTLAGIVFLSLFLEITTRFGTYTEDMLIASVFGGILVGVGVGLTVMRDASTGGSDFAALMIHKIVPHVSVALIIMIIDGIIIAASGVAFENYTITFYSVISLYIASKVTDFLMVRGDWAKSVYIISEKHESIANEIINVLDRGVTGMYGKGIYNDKDRMLLMCIVKSREVPRLLETVKRLDEKAFTIISDVREVHGEGFK